MSSAGVEPPLEGKRVLVTGGAGFLGARVARLAHERGATVTILARSAGAGDRLSDLPIESVQADVTDARATLDAVLRARPHLVVHAAGWPHWRQDPATTLPMMQLHALGSAVVLEAARQAGVERTVLVGTGGEYGDSSAAHAETDAARPIDPYSVSKLAATELALTYHRAFGVPCTIARPFVLYGPGEPAGRLFPSLFDAAARRVASVDVSPGEQRRDFLHVDDAALAILALAVSPRAAGLIVNLGTGVGTRVRDAVRLALSIAGAATEPRFGARPCRPGEPASLVASTARAQDLLGLRPRTLERGLADSWRLYEASTDRTTRSPESPER